MKVLHLQETWAATCVASTFGALYAGVVAAIIAPAATRLPVAMAACVVSILIALPVLAVGSALFGARLSGFLAQRFRTNRILIFAMTGAVLGMVADLVLIVIVHFAFGLSWSDRPRTLTDWTEIALMGTVPMFTLIVAGVVTSLHTLLSEQTGDGDTPEGPR